LINVFPILYLLILYLYFPVDKVNDIKTRNTETFEVNRSFVFVIKDRETIYSVGRIENLDGMAAQVNCSKV